MSNTINTVKNATYAVAKMAAAMLADKNQFIKSIDREDVSIFAHKLEGSQPGDTISITKPARFTTNTGADITGSIQDVTEEQVTLALTNQTNVAVNLTSKELATDLALKSWAKKILEPAMGALSNGIEATLLTAVMNTTNNFVGTPGTVAAAPLTYLQANQKLDELLAPVDDNRFALITPGANAATVDARKGLFQKADEIGKQYKSGYMGTADGLTYLRNNLLPTLTTGTQAGSAAADVAGAVSSGSTVAIEGMTGSATIKKGTIVTFSGSYEVHPITKVAYSYLKQYVITADVTLSGGAGNLTIFPAVVASGTTQNVSAAIADEATVTFLTGAASTSFSQNLVYHKSAVRFASAPLILPGGTDMAAQETVDDITVRVVRDYLPLTDKMVMRIDVLWGYAVVRPEWICRVTN